MREKRDIDKESYRWQIWCPLNVKETFNLVYVSKSIHFLESPFSSSDPTNGKQRWERERQRERERWYEIKMMPYFPGSLRGKAFWFDDMWL